MAVQDDLRRLSQGDSIYLGHSIDITSMIGAATTTFVSWFKGRLQQSNDGNWIFRSVSADGSVVGFQLGAPNQNWSSSESPNTGISVFIPITILVPQPESQSLTPIGTVFLRQQLPRELTN
jgi:hypothetical protein